MKKTVNGKHPPAAFAQRMQLVKAKLPHVSEGTPLTEDEFGTVLVIATANGWKRKRTHPRLQWTRGAHSPASVLAFFQA